MLTTALLPLLSEPLEPMHAQYVPALTDIAPLLLIRELPQDEYPTPALPRPFTSHDVEPIMFGPNITGEFVASAYVPVGTQNGAFRVGPIKDCPNKDNNGGHLFYFDASDSDSTYGATQTVQPPSIRLVQCIKL